MIVALTKLVPFDWNSNRSVLVFFQFETTDSDSGDSRKITYTITSSNAPGLFNVDSNGDVTLERRLNFDSESFYTLTISAEDNINESLRINSNAVLKISVIDGGIGLSKRSSPGCGLHKDSNKGQFPLRIISMGRTEWKLNKR